MKHEVISLEVCERFAIDYPTIEGGYIIDTDDIEHTINELKKYYAFVDAPFNSIRYGWTIDVFENKYIEK